MTTTKPIKTKQSGGRRGFHKVGFGPYPFLILEMLLFGGVLFIILLASVGLFMPPIQLLVGSIFAVVALNLFFQWVAGHPLMWNMRNFIFLGVLFWVLLNPLLMVENLHEFSYNDVVEAFMYVVVFLAMVSFGYSFPPYHNAVNIFSKIHEPRNSRQIFWSISLIYLVGISPILYYSQGSYALFWNILLAGYSHTDEIYWRRPALGGGREFVISFLRYILLSVPFLSSWALMRVQLTRCRKIILFLMISSVLLLLLFEGVRFILGFVILGILLYFYTAVTLKKRRRWMFIFLLSIVIFIQLMSIQVSYRAGGFQNINITSIGVSPMNFIAGENEFYWLLTAVSVMPDKYSFTYDCPFLNIITHPVPRFLWPGKPASKGWPFMLWEERGGETLTSSVIGDFYMAQGLLGVIIVGFVYGWIARNWDQLIRLSSDGNIHSMIYFVGVMLMFLGIRTFDTFVTYWYIELFIITFAYCLGRNKYRKSQLAKHIL